MTVLDDTHRDVLTAVCDTVVPAIERDPDPDGFFARRASDVGVPAAAEDLIATMPDEQREGLKELLGALGDQGFLRASQRSREQILRNVALIGPEAAAGVNGLIGMTLFLHYGLPDERGQNPSWTTFGYPGPISAPPQTERPLRPITPEEDTTLEADVVIVGSGAGGGVMAGRLAQSGLKVIVLEAGGYVDDADFNQLELVAYQQAFWRGGPQSTADMNMTLQAGAALGGGTVINWTNCLRTKPWVRDQWESEFGLEGVAGPEFDRHLDAVWERLGVTDQCSDLNGPQQKMKDGADALGWSFATVTRNTDPERYTPESAGYLGFGDQSGSKQSTAKTYLQDAADHGAEFVTHCFVERVLVENGHAAGVEGAIIDPETRTPTARVKVRAPQVVVACGALESPALLLRSQIGGPAVGDYLRLHPSTATFGYYADDMRSWWGAPHAGLVDEFANADGDGNGFLIEAAQYTTGIAASAVPFSTPQAHKDLMANFRHGGTAIALLRDQGHGRVTIDDAGQAVPWYSITDERDLAMAARGIEVQVKLHEAAGAQQIIALAGGAPTWRWGDDTAAFLERIKRIPLRAGGWKLFSAHQMGTCRMGTDPATSVAGPFGELHDVKGVWIGDASAFPSATGTNPMGTVMALAHRTAEAIASR
jgi:choline dehydrogenase-like flavoprotein